MLDGIDGKITVNVAAKSEFRKAIRIAAEVIRGKMETHAKQNITEAVYDTPETWYRRTGLLRNSISTQVADDGGDTLIAVGTDVEYAPYVELGTGVYAGSHSKAKTIPWTYKGSDGKLHTTSGMTPRPFLRPAVEDNAKEYKGVLEKVLRGT